VSPRIASLLSKRYVPVYVVAVNVAIMLLIGSPWLFACTPRR